MITIITALYKSDKYLPSYAKKINVVAEVLTENNIKFEFILVPQLPTNNEKLILDELAKLPWLRVIENEKPSLYAAWNRAIENSKGDGICFWNVDDSRVPEALMDA